MKKECLKQLKVSNPHEREAIHANYSVFQKDILKRHIFKVPSTSIMELKENWNIETLERNEPISIPTNILEKEYSNQFVMDVEKNCVYYLRLQTIGNDFILRLNEEEIGIGGGKQIKYEIPITSHLKQGKNKLSLQFQNKEVGLLLGATIIKRPKKHILDYKILKTVQSDRIIIEVEPTYANGFIPSQCLLLSDIGKKIKKIKVVEEGKIVLEIPKEDIQIWNDETHVLYSLVFITEEEVIAEKIAIEKEMIKENIYLVDDTPVSLRILNLGKNMDCNRYYEREEIISHMSSWKKRNFNALYVDKSLDHQCLKTLCLEYGFYYLKEGDLPFSMEEEEICINQYGRKEKMPDVYFPIKAWNIQNQSGVIAIKNIQKFQNLKDNYYVRIVTYQGGKQIGHKIKYILDFEAEIEETFHPEWTSNLEGEMVVQIEFYQRYRTKLVEKFYFYGYYEVLIQK